MTLTLQLLAEHYVFQSTPTRHDLGALHVPFDELTNRARTEKRLLDGALRGEKIALIGNSGAGKSSVIAHVLGPLAERIAPILVPLAALPDDTIDTPSHLADHIIDTLARSVKAVASELEAEVATETRTVTKKGQAGIGLNWRWLSGELAREVDEQIKIERQATFADKTDAIASALETVAANYQPVFVFDDTDRWLREDGDTLVDNFFGEAIRWLLELPAGLVVSVHPHYFNATPKAELLRYLDTQIEMPNLDTAESIEAIIARRVAEYAGHADPDVSEVFEADTAAQVLEVYEADTAAQVLEVYKDTGSLRRAIQVCHIALDDALAEGSPTITALHITAATHAG